MEIILTINEIKFIDDKGWGQQRAPNQFKLNTTAKFADFVAVRMTTK